MKLLFCLFLFLIFLLKTCELTPIKHEDFDKNLSKTNFDKSESTYMKKNKTKAIGYSLYNKCIR